MKAARKVKKRSQKRGLYAGAVLLYTSLTMVMTLHIYNFGAYTDFQRHAAWVQDLWVERSFFDFVQVIPYFGWHAFVRFAMYLNMPVNVATAFATSLFNACTAIVCFFYLDRVFNSRLHPIAITALGMIILAVSAIWVPCFNQEIYKGQGSPNPWHNPTYDAVRPVAVLTVILFLDAIHDRSSFSLKQIIVLSLLILLGIALKPSFFAVLLPAMVLYALIDFYWNGDLSFDLKILSPALLPTVIAVILFIRMFFMNGASNESQESGIAFTFFQNRLSPNLFVSEILLIAFPLYAIVACRNEVFCKGSPYVFIVFLLLSGCCECSFFTETGIRAMDGNFSWGLMLATFIAWLYLFPLFVKAKASNRKRRAVKFVGFALVAWHLISGICYLYHLLFIGTFQC